MMTHRPGSLLGCQPTSTRRRRPASVGTPLTPLTLPNRAAQLDYLLTEIQSRSSEESLLPD